MDIVIQLFIMLICGTIAAVIAANKGRSAIGWFFGGFFITIIGIVIVAVISNLKTEQAYRFRVAEEERRLREQLRQERIKAETYRQYTTQRLDTHDQMLDIDTRSLPAGTEEAPPLLQWEADAAAPPAGAGESTWYYEMGEGSVGPVSADIIRGFLKDGVVAPTNLVWSEGMDQWTPISDVPAFQARRTV